MRDGIKGHLDIKKYGCGSNDGESARALMDCNVDIFIASMVRHSITHVCQVRTHTKNEAAREIASWVRKISYAERQKSLETRLTGDNGWKDVSGNKMTQV